MAIFRKNQLSELFDEMVQDNFKLVVYPNEKNIIKKVTNQIMAISYNKYDIDEVIDLLDRIIVDYKQIIIPARDDNPKKYILLFLLENGQTIYINHDELGTRIIKEALCNIQKKALANETKER